MTDSEGACPACGGSGGGPFGPAGSAWDDENYRCAACKGLGVVAAVTSGSVSSAAPKALAPLAKSSSARVHAPASALAETTNAATNKRADLARTRPAHRTRAAAAGPKKR